MIACSRILVAEDDSAMRKVLTFSLEQAGLSVCACSTGRDALEAAQQDRFDLVVTDQQMPYLNGTELCAELRKIPAYDHTPILLLTAKSLELNHKELYKTLGITAVLRKPFSPSYVVKMVKERLPLGTEA